MSHLSNEELLNEAADICYQIKGLEQYKKHLVEAINHRIEEHELEEFRDGTNWKHGRLTVFQSTRRTWTYSDAVKTLKEQEEAEGVATRKVTISTTLKLSDDK